MRSDWEMVSDGRYVLKDNEGNVIARIIKQVTGKWFWLVEPSIGGYESTRDKAMKKAESKLSRFKGL